METALPLEAQNQINQNKSLNLAELPPVLTPELIKKYFFSGETILNRPAVYNLFKRSDFPGFSIGRKLFITKENFLNWLNNPENRKEKR